LRNKKESTHIRCTAPPPHMMYQTDTELRVQTEAVSRQREYTAQSQLAAWKHAAGPGGLVDAKFRFVALLEEAYRHEVAAIRNQRWSRPHTVSDTELLIRDIKASYRQLIIEARRLFDDKKSNGSSPDELHNVSSQATSSFASLYPWSDGVTCRDLVVDHRHFMPLASHRMITAGESGVITLKTFIASMPCAEAKQEAALRRRLARIAAYRRDRAAAKDVLDTDAKTRVGVSEETDPADAATAARTHLNTMSDMAKGIIADEVKAEDKKIVVREVTTVMGGDNTTTTHTTHKKHSKRNSDVPRGRIAGASCSSHHYDDHPTTSSGRRSRTNRREHTYRISER
jgi:hypothetical protein